MKKIFTGLFATLLAAATVFGGTKSSINSEDPLHWFDENGIYLGPALESAQRQVCDGSTTEICMQGYEQIDTEGNPVGEPVTLYKED